MTGARSRPPSAEHGLAALAGSSPDVGVVGYTLGGGLSWLARASTAWPPTACTAIELVTADGRLVRVDADTEPDLFWALRGGGGSFGVVTAIEFELYPIAEVYAGMLVFPMERAGRGAARLARVDARRCPTRSPRSAACCRSRRCPRSPSRCAAASSSSSRPRYSGDERRARADAARAAARARPRDRHVRHDPGRRAAARCTWTRPARCPARATAHAGDELTAEADRRVRRASPAPDSGSPLLSVELRHLGGAVGRAAPGHGARGTIDAEFAMFAVGMAMTPEMNAAVEAHSAGSKEALGPAGTPARATSTSPSGRWTPAGLRVGDAYASLRAVKTLVDPEDLFKANHPIEPIR